MDRVGIWHALPYICTPLRALVLGSLLRLDEVLCSDRPYRSTATYIPQGILLLVWSVKTLSAFDI